jgi:hypothetical protein
MHSCKPYAAATAASSRYDMPATIKPTAVETASGNLSAAKTSTAEAAATKSTAPMEASSASSPSTAAGEGLA